MAWYNEAVFYHIYPLGLTGAPELNDYSAPVSRILNIIPMLDLLKSAGFNAIYIGPLFQSVGHGYETTDYKTLDSRLGTNDDLKAFVKECHSKDIRVIFDGVFNHTGRDFFAFKDIKENRENSRYKHWYNVNFYGNNEYNDGFSYENWGGYNLLVKLNQKNPEVQQYICDVIEFWVDEFDVDGIRLDAADVLDFGFMQRLRQTANSVKPDFWLMGEVIHGDYYRWANDNTLHSVTNYHLHKALYSAHNDRNYFEIAHTVKRLYESCKNLNLYNFADNHDVERIYTKLSEKQHFIPLHVLLYTLPGIPSVYYGSEFAVEGKKERHSDKSLRPAISIEEYKKQYGEHPFIKLISALGKIKQEEKVLSYGDYKELLLTNRQYAFERRSGDYRAVIAVNNDSGEYNINLPAENIGAYSGVLSGKTVKSENGRISFTLKGNSGELFIPADKNKKFVPVEIKAPEIKEEIKLPEIKETKKEEIKVNTSSASKLPTSSAEGSEVTAERRTEKTVSIPDVPYEEMTVEQLQQVILGKLAANGPVTEQMKKDVYENVYHNSLCTWARSFR